MRWTTSGRRRIPAVIGTAALVLIIGRAAMASNTVPSTGSGYGAGSVSGATVQNVSYTVSPDGTTITAATLTVLGDLTGKSVSVGFNGGNVSSCVVGSYSISGNSTSATCSGLSQSNASALTLAVSVHQ